MKNRTDEIFAAVCAAVGLDRAKVTYSTPIIEAGLDSMRLAVVGMELEQSLGMELTDEQIQDLLAAKTLGALVQVLDSAPVA